jgi:hypothetical protein
MSINIYVFLSPDPIVTLVYERVPVDAPVLSDRSFGILSDNISYPDLHKCSMELGLTWQNMEDLNELYPRDVRRRKVAALVKWWNQARGAEKVKVKQLVQALDVTGLKRLADAVTCAFDQGRELCRRDCS